MNFKILTVNGQDLSGASHQVAAEAFKNADEPITVVLRRNSNTGCDKTGNTSQRENTDETHSPNFIAPEPTVAGSDLCFCRFLINNCRSMPAPLSALIMNELLRYKRTISGAGQRNEYNEGSGALLGDDVSSLHEDDVFGVYYEEVVLTRSSSRDKLGMTLCDEVDRMDGCTKVVVNQVALGSIASQSRSIYEGDHIVKVNGTPVSSMTQASRLLSGEALVVTFLIARHQLMEEDWQEVHVQERECGRSARAEQGRDEINDAANYAMVDPYSAVSDESRMRLMEHRCREKTSMGNADAVALQKMATGTTNSGASQFTTVTSAFSTAENDSGIGQTTDSAALSTVLKSNGDARLFGTASSVSSCADHSLAREFTFVAGQKYCQKKCDNASTGTNDDSGDSAKGSMERQPITRRSSEFQRLQEEIESLHLDSEAPAANSIEFCEDDYDDVSPWVKIARQDYQEKIRQFETIGDARLLHPAFCEDAVQLTGERTSSVGTDNTSSAYSTGNSFRSSSTASAPRLSNDSNSPPLSPQQEPGRACHYRSASMPCTNWSEKKAGAAMSCYVSSDANSDLDGPACYLTHDDGSGSEGFADAGLEFSPVFTSATNSHQKLSKAQSAPSPFAGPPGFVSPTPSTRRLCGEAAYAAQSRRLCGSNDSTDSNEPPTSFSWHLSSSKSTACETSSNKDRSECDTVVAANSPKPSFRSDDSSLPDASAVTSPEPAKRHSTRRSSEHPANKPANVYAHSRSHSYTEGQKSAKDASELTDANDVSMEWKVRVRNDGTRYITKRPVRERLLREREKKLMAERCGVTTDDDALTEMKLGRHWSRDDRKRHVRIAREKKKRRDFMMRCRLEVLNEHAPADGEIVELSRKKMARRKQKRMLLDNFVTVQEILAHGDRSAGVAKVNPILSVTYI